MRPCKLCGLDEDLVGKMHRCVPRVSQSVAANAPVSQTDVTNSAKATYRYRDADKWRTYMAAYMRRRRASG